jgi:DNA-binding SARP family transcriptional activator
VLPLSEPSDAGGEDGPAASGPRLRAQTLGAARVLWGAQLITPTFGLQFALLVRLLHTSGHRVPRADIFPELWPGQPEARQRGNLRQLLYKLRTMGMSVSQTDDDVILDKGQVDAVFCVDRSVEHFDRDVTRGDEPFGLWLPGYTGPGAAYERWLSVTRDVVHADVRRVLVTQLRRRRERGDWTGAEVLSRWLLQFDPLNEDATLTIAECVMMNGAKAEAVAILDRYLEELGPDAGDIRLPASQLRRRFTEPSARRRPSLAATERHFVGRETEMAELTMQLRRARWHDGSAVLLHGPAGIGKTRLCTELGKVAQIEGYREVTIECRESDQHRPLGAVMEILPELMSYPGALGCSPESLTVLRRLVGGDDEGRGTLGEDASPTSTDQPRQAIARDSSDPLSRVRLHSVRRAIVDLFAAISDEQPLYFVLEDTHWLDEPSWDALFDVLNRANSLRLFAVITSRFGTIRSPRPERLPLNLIARKLSGISRADCSKLARAIGKDLSTNLSDEVETWIVSSSEGTPLMLRALIEHWLATGDADGVPPTLTALLEQRLDRLSLHAVRALQAIASLGRFASLERIDAVLELPSHELMHALEQLEESGCLAVSQASLVVTHDLVRQVAIGRITSLVSSKLHIKIAEVLEDEFRSTGSPELLLESLSHLARGRSDSTLVAFIHRHEQALLGSGRPQTVLQCLGHLLQSPSPSLNSKRYSRMIARLEAESGNFQRALGSLSNSARITATLEPANTEAVDEHLSYVESAFRSDPIADPVELGEYSGAIASNGEAQFDLRIRAADIGLVIASNTCDQTLAEKCYRGLQATGEAPVGDERIQRIAVMFHTVFGDTDVAYRHAETLINRGLNQPATTALVVDCSRAGYVFRMTGHPNDAKRAFERARSLAFEIDSTRLAEYPTWQLAQVYLEAGNLADAMAFTNLLAEYASTNNDENANSFIHGHLCTMAIFSGERTTALGHLERCKRTLPRIPHIRATAYVTALELTTLLLDANWLPTPDHLGVALDRFERTARFAGGDLLASATIGALARSSDYQTARNVAGRYMSELRRERSAPPFFLRHTLAMLDREN